MGVMRRIREPATGQVHYDGPPLIGNVTLCGMTDTIGGSVLEETGDPVDCRACLSVVDHVLSAKFRYEKKR